MRLLFSNSLPKQIKIIVSEALGRTGEGRGESDFQNSCHVRSGDARIPSNLPATHEGGRGSLIWVRS